jgi:hypothetical protein
MLIRKEADTGITITFEDQDNFNVHINQKDDVLKTTDVYITEVEDECASEQTTTSLVEQLKNVNNIEVEETTEDWDGSEIKTIRKGLNMREFLKENDI